MSEEEESVKIGITLTIPRSWLPCIRRFMEEYGFRHPAQMVRYLIAKYVVSRYERKGGRGV